MSISSSLGGDQWLVPNMRPSTWHNAVERWPQLAPEFRRRVEKVFRQYQLCTRAPHDTPDVQLVKSLECNLDNYQLPLWSVSVNWSTDFYGSMVTSGYVNPQLRQDAYTSQSPQSDLTYAQFLIQTARYVAELLYCNWSVVKVSRSGMCLEVKCTADSVNNNVAKAVLFAAVSLVRVTDQDVYPHFKHMPY